MAIFAFRTIASRGLRKTIVALLVASIALGVLHVQPAQAAPYTDTFTPAPFAGIVTNFTTGTQETGLSYSSVDSDFSIYGDSIYALALIVGPGSFTITSRDGFPFDFNSIYVDTLEPITISGSGPETFAINVAGGTIATVGPAVPSRVSQVVVASAALALDFDVIFDNVSVELYEPEIDIQRPAGTSIPDGSTDDLGPRQLGTVNLTYTIDNSAGTDPLTVTDVTASNFTNVSNFSLVTATPIAVPAGGTATFDLSFDVNVNGAFSFDIDIANNDASENPYDIHIQGVGDNDPPDISSFSRHNPAASPTDADVLVFRVTFDEDVQNVDSTDFAVNSTSTATVTSVATVNASTYDVTVSGGDLAGFNGTVNLNLAGGQNITDLAGNALPAGEPGTDDTYTIDNNPPGITAFTWLTPASSPTNADVLVFQITFDEDVQNIDSTDFAVNSTSTATVTNVATVNASTYDVTVSGGDLAGFNGTVNLNLAGGQNITDLAGNTLPAGEPGTDDTYTIDNDPPGITAFTWLTPASSPTNADVLVFQITFDEDVQNVDSTDFAVNSTSTATVTSVATVDASTYDVTVSGGDLAGYNGTVNLNLAVGQDITDLAGHNLPTVEPGTDEIYTLDNTAPVPEIDQAVGQSDPTSTLPINFAVDFGEDVTGFTTSDLTLGGTAVGTPSAAVTGGPQTFNIAVSGLTGDGTLTVDIVIGAALDTVGNPSAAPILTDNLVTFDGDPEIDIQRPAGTSIADGGTDALGSQSIGTVNLTYTIDNSAGTDQLTVTGVTASNFTNVSNFSLVTVPPINVAGGDTATFDLSFDVIVNGAFSLEIEVANNDASENPYNISVTGTGTGGMPEIDIQRPAGSSIIDDGNDAIGTPGVGTVHLTYTLDNTAGKSQLDVTGVTAVNMTNISNFVLGTAIPINVAALATGSFDISFDVLAEGPFSFDMAIVNNDGDESPYGIHVSGTALDLQVVMGGNTSPLDGDVLYTGPSTLSVEFNKDVQTGGGIGAVDNIANYLLVEAGEDGEHDTLSCLLGVGDDDEFVTIDSVSYDQASLTATLNINGGTPLSNGRYRLLVCGTTSITDLFGIELNGGLSDVLISFLVTDPPPLPATGFAPDQTTHLAAQPVDKQFTSLGALRLEIPSLGIQQDIIGVPQTADGWDVSWLGKSIGYLAGTAFPTWEGNTGLTGHVYDANGQPGPFEKLAKLGWGNQVIIHAYSQKYTYEVRTVNNWVRAADSRLLTRHEDYDWITLITCRAYDEGSDSYKYRSVVRAVLVNVEAE